MLNAGYDIGGVDGIIGDNTRIAIQQYQTSRGIFPADGRAGQNFYRAIVGNANANTNSYSNNAYSSSTNNRPLVPATSDRMGQLIQQQTITPATNTYPSSAQPSSNIRYRRVVSTDGSIKLERIN